MPNFFGGKILKVHLKKQEWILGSLEIWFCCWWSHSAVHSGSGGATQSWKKKQCNKWTAEWMASAVPNTEIKSISPWGEMIPLQCSSFLIEKHQFSRVKLSGATKTLLCYCTYSEYSINTSSSFLQLFWTKHPFCTVIFIKLVLNTWTWNSCKPNIDHGKLSYRFNLEVICLCSQMVSDNSLTALLIQWPWELNLQCMCCQIEEKLKTSSVFAAAQLCFRLVCWGLSKTYVSCLKHEKCCTIHKRAKVVLDSLINVKLV